VLSPAERSTLLLAKMLVLLIYLAVVELVAVPAFAILLLEPSLWQACAMLARSCSGTSDAVMRVWSARWRPYASARPARTARLAALLVPVAARSCALDRALRCREQARRAACVGACAL